MMELLRFLIFGHLHKWKTIDTKNFYERRDLSNPDRMPTGAVYIQQCEGCGKVIRRKLAP